MTNLKPKIMEYIKSVKLCEQIADIFNVYIIQIDFRREDETHSKVRYTFRY